MRLCFGVVATCCAHAAGLLAGQARHEVSPTLGNLPLAWLHIPKAGSSFGNLLMHTPAICPGVPKDFAIDGRHCAWQQAHIPGTVRWEMDNLRCPEHNKISLASACPGLSKWGQHEAVGSLFEQMYRGRGAAMFREPHQRMLSHYQYFLKPWGVPLKSVIPTMAGCMVKMMVRSGDDMKETCQAGPEPSDQETEEAISRLNQFAFVGLSEKWDKSVCLFRKMFGGECVGADFVNTRPTPPSRQASDVPQRQTFADQVQEGESYFEEYDPASLHGFVDKHDLKLYRAAVNKFNALCLQYGVSQDTCKPCYEHKEIAYTPDQR